MTPKIWESVEQNSLWRSTRPSFRSGAIIDINFLLAENCIDGTALAALPEDSEEFKILIPQSGLRIQLKAVIKNYMDSPVVSIWHVKML